MIAPQFLYLTFFCALSTQAQENNRPISTTKPNAIQTLNSTVVMPDSLKGETFEHIDYCIYAIDQKVAHVTSDQELKARAEANGWFDQMAKNRASWVSRRKDLEKVLGKSN